MNLLKLIYYDLYYRYRGIRKYKPVFIVGCGHSGTSIILRILSNHKDLYGVNYESSIMKKHKIIAFKKFNEWQKSAKSEGKKRWVEKTPNHIRYIKKIFKIFPSAKVIVMVRDGRDVAISIKKRKGDLRTAMERWKSDNQLALLYIDEPRVNFLKLEDFTKNPEESIESLCKFLSIDFYEEVLDYHKEEYSLKNVGKAEKPKDVKKIEDHKRNRNWQINQPVFKSTARWVNEAEDYEKQIFEDDKKFRDLLIYFNYTEND